MKGLFDCLRNKVYREDEDILQQITANAAMDDSEIESYEADDEDEDDELFDFSGLDLDAIDDADIERATNEFNMDEGNRAATRIRTIDLREDNVELQPETRLRRKISLDPDGRDFVGAGDGSGHDMQNEEVYEVYEESKKKRAAKVGQQILNNSQKNNSNKMEKVRGLLQNAAENKDKVTKAPSKLGNAAKIAGAAALGAGAVYGGKKLYDHIKAKKAREVAVEEGITLDEAYAFIEQCESDLLAEGFSYAEIYGEDNVELQPETKLVRRISADDDMREFVGASDGSGHDLRSESFQLIMEEVMDEIESYEEKTAGEFVDSAIGGISKGAKSAYKGVKKGVGSAYKGAKKGVKGAYGYAKKHPKTMAALGGVAAGAAGVHAIQKYRARKAKEVAVEEGVTLDEALQFVIECEESLLAEGFSYDEIYEEDSVELQPVAKLNRRISADDDMREFVGASMGPDDDLKTEAMALALEEGITLDEAMEILMSEDAVDDAIEKLSTKGVNNGVFPNRIDLQDEMYDEDADECAPKRQQQKAMGDVGAVSVDGVDSDDELMLGVEAVVREIEESYNDYDM